MPCGKFVGLPIPEIPLNPFKFLKKRIYHMASFNEFNGIYGNLKEFKGIGSPVSCGKFVF